MKLDLSLHQYIDWEVSPVMSLKGKYGFRVFLKYMDGAVKPQQKSGFETEKEANAARERTIGELYSGKYIVYTNVWVKDFLEFWIEEDIKNRVGSYETFKGSAKRHIIPVLGNKRMTELTRGDVQKLYNEKTDYSISVARMSDGTLWEAQTALCFRCKHLSDCAVPVLAADSSRDGRRLS